MTDSTGTHKNHVGIGIRRSDYNKLRKAAKKQDISMRELFHQIVEANLQ